MWFLFPQFFIKELVVHRGTEGREVVRMTESCSMAAVKKCINTLYVSGRLKAHPCAGSIGQPRDDYGLKDCPLVVVGQTMRSEQSNE